MRRNKALMEKYQKITESKSAVPIRNDEKALFERLLHNEMKYLSERTFSGDLAALGQVIVPVYRRAFPQMIGKEIAGVQPMSQSTGYAFALRYHYAGNTTGNAGNRVIGGASSHNTTDWHITTPNPNRNAANSLILIWNSAANRALDAPAVDYNDAPVAGTGDLAGLATIIYTETNKAVVRVAGSGNTLDDIIALVDASGSNIIDYYDNEAGYINILKNYSGPMSTLIGEQLGDDMPEIGLTLDKIAIQARTRKLKAKYSIESAQDLKASHGKDMASELIDILQYEIAQAVDRDIIDEMLSQAVASTVDVSTEMDGRWQLEKFRSVYTEMIRKSNDIARTTMRGPGNFIVGSPDVVTMVEQIPTFKGIAPIMGDVDTNVPANISGQSKVGSIGGRFIIYRDVFAASNYALIGYRGANNYDAGVIYSPYIPMEMKETVDQESGNPNIIFLERSSISSNIFSSDLYYRRITFSNIFSKSS